MTNYQSRRRKIALAVRVAERHLQGHVSLHDPMFNLREIVKQLLLLEDHLFHSDKHCMDCIRKHTMTIEALAEEMPTLESNPKGIPIWDRSCKKLAELCREWLEKIEGGDDSAGLGLDVRLLRKGLTPLVCADTAADRLATTYLARTHTT